MRRKKSMSWSHDSQSLKICFLKTLGRVVNGAKKQPRSQIATTSHLPASTENSISLWGRCLGQEVLPAVSLVECIAFLMKCEVWKLWNKYPKVKARLNKCEISQTQAPPWNSLVLECLVLFIEDSSLTQGLRWLGRERLERIQTSLGRLDQMNLKILSNLENLGSSDLICPVLIPTHLIFYENAMLPLWALGEVLMFSLEKLNALALLLKAGSWSGSISMTWELVRNWEFQAHPRPIES